LVVIAPHPDDETLGCGGLLARASDLGLAPRVMFLTDGAASHRGSAQWPPGRLAAARAVEALDALRDLGLGEDQVLFLAWPDGQPKTAQSDAYEVSVTQALAFIGPRDIRSLWAPWRREAHCDHQAAYAMAMDLRRRLGAAPRLMQYLVWGWSSDQLTTDHGASAIWALPCQDAVPRRRSALQRHRTQHAGLILDAQEAFTIPPDLAALVERPLEIFLEQ
jgi:LmbE family N-acetylglucosaminyl deacetylase